MSNAQAPIDNRLFKTLGTILSDGIDVHRCAAATALAKQNHSGAGARLQKALRDEDEDVRCDAATALANLGDRRTARALMESFIGDPCPDVKLIALEALSAMQYQPIVPHLRKLVRSREGDIDWDDSGYFDSGWDDWLDIQMASIKALGQMRITSGVRDIVAALHDEAGQDVSAAAIPALAQLGKEGPAALCELYKAGNEQLRRRICAALTPGASAQIDDLLARCLGDAASDVRATALEALIDHDLDDERLASFFNDKDPGIRAVVIEHLGPGNPAQVHLRLSDRSPDVRQAAFRVIAKHPEIFEKEGFTDVVRKAIAGVPKVAGDAALAWAALIGAPCARSLGEAFRNPQQPLAFRLALIEALGSLGNAGLAQLSIAAADQNRQLRVSALSAIAGVAKQTPWPNQAGEILMAALGGSLVVASPEAPDAGMPDADETEAGDGTAAGDHSRREAATEPETSEPEIPTSTLAQFMTQGLRTEAAPDADEPPAKEVELSDEDRHFIEISKLRAMKKMKVSLDVKVAPHQDVRQFAARLLGDFNETGLADKLCQAMDNRPPCEPAAPGQSADEAAPCPQDVQIMQITQGAKRPTDRQSQSNAQVAQGAAVAPAKIVDSDLILSCLESLALIGATRGNLPERLSAAIIRQAGHKDRNIRMMGARCLGYIETSEITTATDTAATADAVVAADAVAAADAAAACVSDLHQDKDVHVRMEAVRAMGRQRHKIEIEVLLRRDLHDEYSGVRMAAAKALGGDAGHLKLLVELSFMHDGMHQKDLVDIFVQGDVSAAMAHYLGVLGDESRKRVWLVAIEALGNLTVAPRGQKALVAA